MLALDEIRRRNLERARALRKEIQEARQSAIVQNILGGNTGSGCSICAKLKHCQEIMKYGKLMPCQPQEQTPVLNVREAGDYAQDYGKNQRGR